MAADRGFIQRSIERTAREEEATILRELSELDGVFSGGFRMHSPSWKAERQRVTAAGADRAGTRILTEVRTLAGQDTSTLADEAGGCFAQLSDRLLNHHREVILGGRKQDRSYPDVESSCQGLTEALRAVKERVVDELRHRPVSSPPIQAPLAGRDIIITAHGPVAMAGRDAVQNIEGLDAMSLLAVLSQFRRTVEASSIAAEQREALTDHAAAIEAIAQQASPDKGRVVRLVKGLMTTSKDLGVSVAAELLAAYLKQHLGLP
jgi:hypothetical protein